MASEITENSDPKPYMLDEINYVFWKAQARIYDPNLQSKI